MSGIQVGIEVFFFWQSTHVFNDLVIHKFASMLDAAVYLDLCIEYCYNTLHCQGKPLVVQLYVVTQLIFVHTGALILYLCVIYNSWPMYKMCTTVELY